MSPYPNKYKFPHVCSSVLLSKVGQSLNPKPRQGERLAKNILPQRNLKRGPGRTTTQFRVQEICLGFLVWGSGFAQVFAFERRAASDMQRVLKSC